jgi:hypothetical protein
MVPFKGLNDFATRVHEEVRIARLEKYFGELEKDLNCGDRLTLPFDWEQGMQRTINSCPRTEDERQPVERG